MLQRLPSMASVSRPSVAVCAPPAARRARSAAATGARQPQGLVPLRRSISARASAPGVDVTAEAITEVLCRSDFEDAIEAAGESLVVINIGSSKCGPCKMIYPKYVDMSKEFGESAKFLKIVGDTNAETVVRCLSRRCMRCLCLPAVAVVTELGRRLRNAESKFIPFLRP